MGAQVLLGIGEADLAAHIAAQIEEHADLVVRGRSASSGDLLERLGGAEVDVVLLHERLGPLPVMDLAREVGRRFPHVGVVLLVAEDSPKVLQAALRAGVRGVLVVPPDLEDLHATLAAAGAWAQAVRAVPVVDDDGVAGGGLGGRMLVLAGGKGGVGTTTIAVHLALETARASAERSVCLVDFDLQSGDVRSVLDVTHRRSVADLVDIADELTGRTLDDSLWVHRSGLRVLLPPPDGEQADDVHGVAARQILGGLRSRYDVVFVDVGAVMTGAGAVAVEMADEVVLVTTPDVVSLRAANRLLGLWQRLQIRSDGVRVLVNRVSKRLEVQPDLVGEVVDAPLLDSTVPSRFLELEAAVNTGVPERVEDGPLRTAWHAVAVELGLASRSRGLRRGRSRGANGSNPDPVLADERGAVATETLGITPVLLVVLALVWQITLVGATFVLAGHAAREGARDLALGEDETAVVEAVVADLPRGWRDAAETDVGESRVEVSLAVPALLPGSATPWRLSASTGAVVE